MVDVRPVLLVNGVLLIFLGSFMVLPALADFAVGHSDAWVFLASAALTVFCGVAFYFTNLGHTGQLTIQQAFLMTTSAWVILAAFGAFPFWLSDFGIDYTDAYFESMSGLTTTGSTILTGLDTAPPGILLWRALLQWLGGIGIIVMAIAILPMLQVGGMQLYKTEWTDNQEQILPRATQIAMQITIIYLGYTIACAMCFMTAGMTAFEAMAHAMTTISTGGFSTSDSSIGKFDSIVIDYITVVFMVIGSLPFVHYVQLFRGRPNALLFDRQVWWFMGVVAMLTAFVTLIAMASSPHQGWDALQAACFNVVSIMTGTGFATEAYDTWGTMAITAFFFLMFIGGCAGSTSCGIKIFRFQIFNALIFQHIRKAMYPDGVFLVRYNGRPVNENVTSSVMSFMFLFVCCFLILALALSLLGLDTLTAFSSAGTAIANVGPGLGPEVGPSSTFKNLPDLAKWLMSFGMLLGRLELFTVLVLFVPSFWRI